MKIVYKTSFEHGAPSRVNEYSVPPGVISAFYVYKPKIFYHQSLLNALFKVTSLQRKNLKVKEVRFYGKQKYQSTIRF